METEKLNEKDLLKKARETLEKPDTFTYDELERLRKKSQEENGIPNPTHEKTKVLRLEEIVLRLIPMVEEKNETISDIAHRYKEQEREMNEVKHDLEQRTIEIIGRKDEMLNEREERLQEREERLQTKRDYRKNLSLKLWLICNPLSQVFLILVAGGNENNLGIYVFYFTFVLWCGIGIKMFLQKVSAIIQKAW